MIGIGVDLVYKLVMVSGTLRRQSVEGKVMDFNRKPFQVKLYL